MISTISWWFISTRVSTIPNFTHQLRWLMSWHDIAWPPTFLVEHTNTQPIWILIWTFILIYVELQNTHKHINIYVYTVYTLWLFNIAMENDPFIDGLPFLKMGGSFHGYVNVYQRVHTHTLLQAQLETPRSSRVPIIWSSENHHRISQGLHTKKLPGHLAI